jgi:hypothetical protein
VEPEGSLPHSQVTVLTFRNTIPFLRRGVVSTSLNLLVGGPHLVGCPRQFIQYIRSYPRYWKSFFHHQPEDAPCRGDRDPLIMASHEVIGLLFYCNCDSTRWQRSVSLYRNRKEIAIYRRRNNKQNNTKTQSTKKEKTNIQNKKRSIKTTLKNIHRVISNKS